MSADDLLLDDLDPSDRRALLQDQLLQRERRRADQAEALLRELDALDPPDRTTWRLVAIWRERAERDGTLRALAERVVRQVIRKQDPSDAIAAWKAEMERD